MPDSTETSKSKRVRAGRLAEGQYFFIKEYKNKSGSISYHVEGTPPSTVENPNPERVRQNRTTLAEAQNLLNELELAAQNIEVAEKIILQATRLNSQQLKKAEIAFDELAGGDPHNLVAAVRFWKQHNHGINTTIGLREALARCTAAKIAAGRKKDTVEGYRFAVESFLELYGEPTGQVDEKGREIKDILVAHITRHQIKKWVEGHSVRQTGLNKKKALSAILTWCVENEHLKTNWAIGVRLETISQKPKRISLLINGQCQAFLNKAALYEDGVAMPYVVACMFGAIRPEEAPKIEFDEVNLEKKYIRLHHTKTGLKRIVELPENATAILQFYWKNRRGNFRIKNLRRIMAVLKAAAGFRDRACNISERPEGWESFPRWPHDVMRHTGLSNKLTATNDVNETTRWGGNSPRVFYEHYHGLVSADQAAEFWSMLPDSMPRSSELMERIRLELVEWGLIKKDEMLPSAPEVPKLFYPNRKQPADLLKIAMDELKALVWKHPARAVARMVGCSAVFLHRYCHHKGIPTPPRGYWTLSRIGHKVIIDPDITNPLPGEPHAPALKAQNTATLCSGALIEVASTAPVPSYSETTAVKDTRRPKGFKPVITISIPAAPRTQKGLIQWQKISDEDLLRWVWTYPILRIATEWGVWDNTIRKQLKKRGIVSPAPGYWAKATAGHPVSKPGLFEAA